MLDYFTTSLTKQLQFRSKDFRLASLGIGIFLFLSSINIINAATAELIISKEPTEPGIIPVFVYVDSFEQPTIGTDLLIEYAPDKVIFSEVKFTDLYPNQHEVKHDQINHTIRFSGTYNFNSYQPVQGLLATAYFTYLNINDVIPKSDDHPIWIKWEKDNTSDTNIVSIDGQDLITTAPAKIRVDPTITERGEIKGVLTEEQLTLLDESGIIAEVTAIKTKIDWNNLLVGIAIVLTSLGIFAWIILGKRKKDKEDNETSVKASTRV